MHILQAQHRISPYLWPTRVEPAYGLDVWFKLENTNLTHSFKIRGALNAVLSLPQGSPGIVTASSGNHAQALAYAAALAGVPARILMPGHTPQRKVQGVRQHGVTALLDYANYDEAEAAAHKMAHDEGLTFISPYNDPAVIAGAGTIGLEILDQVPDVARVIVCVGGGGLIGGIALAVRSQRPDVEIVGVNALSAPTMHNLFYGTDYTENWDTLAEALSGGIEPGAITINLARQYVDRIVLVNEEQIAAAMRWLIEVQGWLIEGGGAVGLAAVLHNLIPLDRKTVIVLSGGNLDVATLRRVVR